VVFEARNLVTKEFAAIKVIKVEPGCTFTNVSLVLLNVCMVDIFNILFLLLKTQGLFCVCRRPPQSWLLVGFFWYYDLLTVKWALAKQVVNSFVRNHI
jgi:hypothetical protein